MKKLNKKGFTLVEILATIALLGVVMLIAVGSFNVIKKKVLERQYKAVVTSLYSAGNKYYNNTGEIAIYVKDLVKLGYIEADKNDKFIDPVNGFDMAGNNLFLLMKDNPNKDLYYFDEKKVRKTYNHNIDITGKNFVYLPLKDGIKTYSKGNIIDKEDVLNDSKWTNGDIDLKYEPGELNSQILGGKPTELKYSWYSSYNSYNKLSKDKELKIDFVKFGEVYEDEYTLVVENEKEETKKVFTKKIHIDKINPTITAESLNNEATVQIKISDVGSGVDYTKFKIYSCNDEYCNDTEETTSDPIKIDDTHFQFDNLNTGYYIFEIYDKAGNKNQTGKVRILKNEDCYAKYGNHSPEWVPTYKDYKIGTYSIGTDMTFRKKGYTHIGFKDKEGTPYKNGHKFTSVEIGNLCEHFNNSIEFTPQYAEDKIIYYVNSPSSYRVGIINHDVTKGSFSNGEETYTQTLNNNNNTFVIRSAPENLPYYKVIGQVNLKFIGWSLSPSYISILSPGTKIKEDEFRGLLGEYYSSNNISTGVEDGTVKLFGVYSKNDIDITFNTNGCGTIDGSNSYVITTGKNILINFEYINFSPKDKLLKWCTSKNCDGCGNDEYSVDISHGFSSDTTLYAQCKTETPPPEPENETYSITYDANGGTFNGEKCNGSQPCIISNISGPTYLISDKPTKANYVFDYWCTTTNCDSNDRWTSNYMYEREEDIILYAHYHILNDGYIPDDDIPDDNDDIPDEEEQTTASTTYTITYNANGGTFNGDDGCSGTTCKKSYSTTQNAKITKAQPTKENYTFDYWGTKEGVCVWPVCSKYESEEVYKKKQDVTLYAHYKENDEVKIKYEWGNCDSDYRNGSLPSKGNQYVNTEYTISDSKPNCSYHQFLYWVDDKGGTYNPGDKILVYSKDLTLTAHFAPTHYKITYKATNITRLGLGQSVVNNTYSEYVKIGVPHTIYDHSTIVTYLNKRTFDDDYRFEYWNAGNINIYKPGNKIYLTKDMILNAVYYKYRYDVIFKSTLHLSIGSGCNNQKVNSGNTFSIPTSCQINGSTSGNTTYTHDGTFYISWPLEYINNTYYRGQSYSNPTRDNSDIYLKPNSNSETKIETVVDDVPIEQQYINPTPVPTTLCTVTYYVDNNQYTTDSVICDNYVTIANFDKTYIEKGNTKRYFFDSWSCNGQSLKPNSTFKLSSNMNCYGNYFDICKYDQDHEGLNHMRKANEYLFVGKYEAYKTSSPGTICYDDNVVTGGNVKYIKVCDGSECPNALYMKTAQDINNAYLCNYNTLHC